MGNRGDWECILRDFGVIGCKDWMEMAVLGCREGALSGKDVGSGGRKAVNGCGNNGYMRCVVIEIVYFGFSVFAQDRMRLGTIKSKISFSFVSVLNFRYLCTLLRQVDPT